MTQRYRNVQETGLSIDWDGRSCLRSGDADERRTEKLAANHFEVMRSGCPKS